MIWKLTDKVWWGNADALAEERPSCYLAVGGNLENLPVQFTPLNVPEKIPYLRLATPDHEKVSEKYFHTLMDLMCLVIRKHDWLPVLVHCRAGQQRSACVAAVFASYIHNEPLDKMIRRVRELRADAMRFSDGSVPPYCQSLLAFLGCDAR